MYIFLLWCTLKICAYVTKALALANYINLDTPSGHGSRGTSLFDILLMICQVGEQMKCAARISFCANRAKVQIMRAAAAAAVATMDKRDTLPPLHSIQISRYGLLSFTLSFCIFPFHFFLLLFATAAVQMFVTNRTAVEESLPHSPAPASASLEMHKCPKRY